MKEKENNKKGNAKAAPEEVRAMFIALFDESKDVFERMDAFKMQSTVLLEKYGNGAAQHYQYENAISTYLWLRYPDKYYIYKFGEVKAVASELESDYRFKKGAYADNIRNFLKLYDEISVALKEDTELVNLFQSQLTDTCYPDPELLPRPAARLFLRRFFAYWSTRRLIHRSEMPLKRRATPPILTMVAAMPKAWLTRVRPRTIVSTAAKRETHHFL